MTLTSSWRRIPRTLLFLFLGLILLPACQGNADSAVKAPNFTLLNLQGETVRLSDYKGRVVLVNFFAKHCPPCRREIPDLVSLQERHADKGFEILGISVDQNPRRVLPDFVQALKINYPVLLATSKVLRDYGNVYSIPISFLIGRDQKILKKYTGMVFEKELEPEILRALR